MTCLNGITLNAPTGVLIQYSVAGTAPWTEILNLTHKYIRFSKNGGSTWSIGRKFIGDDGADGSDATSSGILYNTMSIGDITPTGDEEITDLYSLAASTLVSNSPYADMLKITVIGTLPYPYDKDVTVRIYFGDTNPGSIIGELVMNGAVTEETSHFKLESIISRKTSAIQVIESHTFRQGDPGSMDETPIIYSTTFDLTTELPINLKILDDTSILESNTPVTINVFRIELIKSLV